MANEFIGLTKTAGDGSFTIAVQSAPSGVFAELSLYAAAAGSGLQMKTLHPSRRLQTVELKLGKEHAVRGQLIDLKGQPVAGAKIRVVRRHGPPPANEFPIWKPVTSDDRGRFLIRGLGSDVAIVWIEAQGFAAQQYEVTPELISRNDPTTLSLSPAKTLNGTVTYADTGKPASGAVVVAPADLIGPRAIRATCDGEGRYHIDPFTPNASNVPPGRSVSYSLNVFPPNGQQYLVEQLKVPDFRGAERTIDVQLRRGVQVSGVITEASTGEPIAGARIQFNEAKRLYIAAQLEPSRLHCAISDEKGRYAFAVPAKKGQFFVLGPTLDYINVGVRLKNNYQYADAIVPFAPSADKKQDVAITLEKGVRLKGRVVDADGKPVPEFRLESHDYLLRGYSHYAASILQGSDGEFELPGCNAKKPHTVYIFDPARKLGATAELTGRNAKEPAVIVLQPCSEATAKFVDSDGKPLAGYIPRIEYVLRDGVPKRVYFDPRKRKFPVEADQCSLDRLHGSRSDKADEHGAMTLRDLVPGLTYRIQWMPEGGFSNRDTAPWPHKDFVVQAGKVTDLGTIVINK